MNSSVKGSSKYPLIAEIKKALNSRRKQPTGAGAKRDDKLRKAELKALGMKDKIKGSK